MYHPDTMLRLAKDRRETFEQEAKRDRLAREASSANRPEPHERFSVRNLRWILMRPAGA